VLSKQQLSIHYQWIKPGLPKRAKTNKQGRNQDKGVYAIYYGWLSPVHCISMALHKAIGCFPGMELIPLSLSSSLFTGDK
jgi:hypothetical protein